MNSEQLDILSVTIMFLMLSLVIRIGVLLS